MMPEKYILILFGTNEVAYSAAAALEGTGYKIVCFFSEAANNFVKFSDKIHVKGFSVFPWDSDKYLQGLTAFLKRFDSSKRILTLLCNDEAVFFWIKHQVVLSQYCTALTEKVEDFYDKISLYSLLGQISVAHPLSWPLSEASEDRLPFLIKPAFRDLSSGANAGDGRKIKIIRNASDFKKLELVNPERWICQEILEFNMGDEYSWWGYRSPTGEISSTVARHKRKFPNKNGRVSNLEIIAHPSIKLVGDSIVKQLDCRGIAEIQFIFDRNANIFKVTDFNPRLWCGHSALLINNMNLIKNCADDYYQSPIENSAGASLYELETFHRKEWFSILDNFYDFNVFKIRCSEFCGRGSDNFKTRVLLSVFLFVKFVYYFLTQGLIRK